MVQNDEEYAPGDPVVAYGPDLDIKDKTTGHAATRLASNASGRLESQRIGMPTTPRDNDTLTTGPRKSRPKSPDRSGTGRQDAAKPAANFVDEPPQSTTLTDYDREHLALYLRLLDAAEEGAEWTEVVQVLFGLDPNREGERARRVHDNHLARARWMTEHGYDDLLRSAMH